MAVQAHMYRNSFGGDPGGGGLGNDNDDLGFNLQLQRQQQQFLMPQQVQDPHPKNQFVGMCNEFVFSALNQISTASSSRSMVEKEKGGIDYCINQRMEGLKTVLQHQRKQHLASIFRKLEARAGAIMRQKDEQIAQATKRTMELKAFLNRLEMENQTWKEIAAENETVIANLNAATQQFREKAAFTEFDAESCCEENNNSKRRKRMPMVMNMDMVCQSCNSRDCDVLFLPCRHLCCCTACEPFLYACPVCNSTKKGSIQALIS